MAATCLTATIFMLSNVLENMKKAAVIKVPSLFLEADANLLNNSSC